MNRFGNQYRIAIGKETSYGSGFTNLSGEAGSVRFEDLLIHSGMINMAPEISVIPTGYRSMTHFDTLCDEVPDTRSGIVTVSGSATVAILNKYLEGVLVEDGGNRVFPSDTSELPSFVLYQIWSDTPAGSNYTVFATKGAKLTQFVITGAFGSLLQFEATFQTQEIKREATVEITGTDPGISCGDWLHFADVLPVFDDVSETNFEAFSISLVNELTADAYKYANNYTITNPVVIRQGGEITYTRNYDAAGNEKTITMLNAEDTLTIIKIDGLGNIYIVSVPTSYELP